jgi:autotransporter-associated beta strand protein
MRFAALLAIFSACGASSAAPIPAFPGAEGFGKYATGGRGGTVYHVTNLNDSGAGSFRDAVSATNRTVVFDVGGLICITNRITVAQNITIAGQTAPGDGITVYSNGISFSGAHNAIVRFIRVRQGVKGSDGSDAVTMTGNSHDMIFDHLSVSWGRDETFSISSDSAPYPTNITIQSTIISQGLQTHSAGGLIQTPGGVSILRSLYIDNDTRNPKFKFNSEYVNNVVYGWETAAYIMGGDSAGDSYANAFNNYFINGANGDGAAFSGGNENFHIYATNNWQDANQDGVLNGAEISYANYGPMDLQSTPYAYPITNALPPLTALKLAVSDVGASWQRDSVDERMMTELTSWGTLGETIASEYASPMNGPGTVKNGTPYTDTDQDGMPDFWEAGLGMNTNSANNNVTNASGYTQLEEYLNWLADPHGIALTNTTVCVDLRQFTRGFTNSSPVYSVFNATNGTVTLFNSYYARFVPAAGYTGPAGFQFTVTDADGSTLTRPMNLFFTPLAQSFAPVWRGDSLTNNWNTLGDFNWFNGQSLFYPFHTGDNVTFDDAGSISPAVSLVGTLQPASVTFNAARNYIFSGSGSLSGTMTLNKTGTGTLTLGTTNNFTGATTVSNGTLLVHGSLNQSAVTVRSGGTIGGNGRLGPAPTLQSGAAIAPGNGIGGAGTLTITNGLTESGGINNRFDLSDDPTGLVKTNDQINVVGALIASGKNYIRVSLLDGPLANGTYPLIKYSSFTNSLTNFVLINANGVLTNPPGAIAIHVNNIRTPGNLKWAGNGVNNTWDEGTTTNWLNGANPDVFYFFDTILFDDTGSTNPPVNLTGSLTPASLTVNATRNYTFSGNGKISGYGTLTKTNSGTLTILATNDYAGPTVIAGGTLSVALLANSEVPSAIGAAESSPDNLVFSGGTLRYTGSTASTDHGVTLNPNGGTLDVSSSATTLTMSNTIVGSGTLTKTGAGRLDLSVASDYDGGTVINGGTLRMVVATGLGSGTVTLNGTTGSATFLFGADAQTLPNTLNVTGTNNFFTLPGNDTVSDMTGSGTVTLNGGTTFTFGSDMTGFSGTIAVGTTTNPRFNGSSGSSNALFDLGNTSALLNTRNGGSTIYMGALSGGSNARLQGASSAVGDGSPTVYVIGGKNLNTTFAGRISQVIISRYVSLVKAGTGTFTLTGINTNTGPTTVNGGTLLVNTATSYGLGTNTVTVNNGGTLGGTGLVGGAVTVASGGALAPGGPGNIGTLSISNSLTLNSSAILWFECGTSCDKIAVTNALVLGGGLYVTNLAGFGPGTNIIITYGGALSGSLAISNQPAGYSCTILTNIANQVRLAVTVSAQPRFGSATNSVGGLVFSGDGGTASGNYYLLASTNLVPPLANWQRVATNQFKNDGSFNFTNIWVTNAPQQFYRLQLP